MVLEEGAKVLIVHRRLFEGDSSRFFVGVVDGYEAGIAKVTGYSWVREQFGGAFLPKEDQRTKIVSFSSGTLIVYELPDEIEVRSARIEIGSEGKVWLRDGKTFKMDLSEASHRAPQVAKKK